LHGWRKTLPSNTPAPAATRLQAAFLALSAEIAKRAQTDAASTNLDRWCGICQISGSLKKLGVLAPVQNPVPLATWWLHEQKPETKKPGRTGLSR
jgi:hypothetical protein